MAVAVANEPGVDDYENPGLVRSLEASERVGTNYASRMLLEALRFLAVKAETNEALTPSEPVDEAWHRFILRTRDYEAYCAAHFGRFVHHTPIDDDDPDAQKARYQRTRELMEERFGPLDPELWPRASVCGCR